MRPASLPLSPTTTPLPAIARRLASALAPFLLAAATALLAPASAHAAPPKTYNKAGVSFQYPANWKITLDEIANESAGIRNVDLEGPGDEIITLSFIPFMSGRDIALTAARAAQQRADLSAKDAAAEQAPEDRVSITPATSTTITRRVRGKEVKGVLQHFSYVGQGGSLPVEAGFYALDFGDASVTIMTQTLVEHAKSMESALGLAMGTLRYRAKR